jgi:hypothetical protein
MCAAFWRLGDRGAISDGSLSENCSLVKHVSTKTAKAAVPSGLACSPNPDWVSVRLASRATYTLIVKDCQAFSAQTKKGEGLPPSP